jgi:hypothetical protein
MTLRMGQFGIVMDTEGATLQQSGKETTWEHLLVRAAVAGAELPSIPMSRGVIAVECE